MSDLGIEMYGDGVTNEQQKLVRLVEPVAVVKAEFLAQRPLMRAADLYRGPKKLLEGMAGEFEELQVELHTLKTLPRDQWNGQLFKAAGEAADVLVFGAALSAVHGIWSINFGERNDFFEYLRLVSEVQDLIGVPISSVAAGVILHKNDRFNYRKSFFQLLYGESGSQSIERFNTTVRGLKLLRKLNPDGILTDEILSAQGYLDFIHGQCPNLIYEWIKGIANGTLLSLDN